ncbi:MAG TPA: RDD family protein [Flavobacterium sp.]|uniref:RDD family protein n=1 Tax=Flavobacterium sp. TaxID=239 RepID=UPI002C78F906|nr:RDD family protein [Flavobacterium sp.]HSD14071.1 RDD family protein [Flavobacterium sp.]
MATNTFRITSDMLASQGQRFLNYLIDLGLQYGVGLLFGVFIAVIANVFGNYTLLDFFESMGRIEEYLVGTVISLIYYALCETFLSRTLGKYITKTIVVMEDGSKPDASTILKRSFSRIIPFNALSFLSNSGRGWHDSISGTYVVKKDLFEEQRKLFYSFDEIGKQEE